MNRNMLGWSIAVIANPWLISWAEVVPSSQGGSWTLTSSSKTSNPDLKSRNKIENVQVAEADGPFTPFTIALGCSYLLFVCESEGIFVSSVGSKSV
jgi:hypothetical protein